MSARSRVAMCVTALVLLMALVPVLPATAQDAPPGDDCLRVVGHVPLAGEAFDGRLIVFFSEPLVWDGAGEASPLVLEPALEGAFEVDANHVVFTPATKLTGDRVSVAVSPNEALRGASGAAPCTEQGFTVTTFNFDVRRVWQLPETPEDDRLRIALQFNAVPDAAQLEKKLRVEDAAGNALTATIAQGDSPEQVVVAVASGTPEPLYIIVAPGLRMVDSNVATAERKRFRYPAPEPLQVTSVDWLGNDPSEVTVRIGFSEPVQPRALGKHLALADADTAETIEYTVDQDEPAKTVDLVLTTPLEDGTRVQVSLAAGLGSMGLAKLPNLFEATLLYNARELRIERLGWDYRGVEGPVLTMRLSDGVDAEALREHLSVSPDVANLRLENSGGAEYYDVYADWVTDEEYEVTLQPGISDTQGRFTRTEPQTMRARDVPRVRGARFAHPGKVYLPRQLGDKLVLQSRNYDEVDISVSRLFPSNVAVMLDSIHGDEADWEFDNRWCEELESQQVAIESVTDKTIDTPVALQSLFGAHDRGVFHLRVQESNEDKVIVWTNLGLLAHWQDDAVEVFVHDLTTLAPVANAKVTVHSSKNQPMGTVYTGEDGVARFEALRTALGYPRVVVAEFDNDYTFLELDRRYEDMEAFEPAMPRYDETKYDAFIYGDRDIYRPGETVHLRWLVRMPDGTAAAGVPLKLEVYRPTGSELLDQTVTLSELGTGEHDITTEKSWPTGEYTVTLTIPGGGDAGRYVFNVEEFVPNRMEASVSVSEGPWVAGQEQTITVRADHLFGAPASGRKAEAEIVYYKSDFSLPGWEGYRFSNDEEFTPYRETVGEAETGENGEATFSYTHEQEAGQLFPLRAVVRGRVFELGGRAVTASTETTIVPDGPLLGLSLESGNEAQGVVAHVAAVHANGEPATLQAVTVIVERETWRYNVRRYDGYYEPAWTREFQRVSKQDVAVQQGRGEVALGLRGGYGHYRVRVVSDETGPYAARKFYTWWDGRLEMADETRPSLLTVTAERDTYEVGEEIVVKLEAPFDGRAFVTIQGDGFKQSMTTLMENGTGEVRFAAGPEHVPNVYVHATLVHRLKEDSDNVYPWSTFAMIRVPVKEPRRKVTIAFPNLPEEMRPAQAWQLPVETRDHAGNPVAAEVTLAVVDEGVLALTNYKTPDPYSWLMRPRRPDYNRAHYYDRVAYDFGQTPIGGDGLGARLGEDAPFVGDNWIKPLALWSGVLKTGEDGKATANFELPEFNGKVRVVAVACTAEALGSAGENVFIRRPYMLRTNLPRFLHAGDSFSASAVVFNTQAAEVEATVTWKAEGALSSTSGSKTVTVPAQGEAKVGVDFSAGEAIGQGAITWTLEAGGEQYEERAPIPVRPSVFFETHFDTLVLKPGESQTFENTRFLEGANMETELRATVNPLLPLAPTLKELVGYPYGCVEQTTSRCFPLYMLRADDNLLGNAVGLSKANIDHYIENGIERLFSLQTSSGGLSFWPGGDSTYAYGSVYACHFLTLVKRDRAYALPDKAFASLQNYVRRLANDWEGSMDEYRSWHEHSQLFLRAYAHYVLALDGDIEAIRQVERFDTIPLPKAARFLLAAALLHNTDDRNRVSLYLAEKPVFDYGVSEQDATLNSDIRNDAIELLSRAQMNFEPDVQAELAAKLTRAIQDGRRLNTQEMAFVITALGEYLRALEIDLDAAKFSVTGPEGEHVIEGGGQYSKRKRGSKVSYTVNNTGGTDVYVYVRTAGTPMEPMRKAVSEGFTVERVLLPYGNDGAVGDTLTQGASYLVRVNLETAEDGRHAVLDVPLAAGMELENPRLDDELLAGLDLDDQAVPSHYEVRDDRYIAAFNYLGQGSHAVYFVVRAVTPGSFQWPGARAELMYQPAVNGRDAMMDITVK